MLEAMLNHVEAGYTANGNPYHNNMHACDVLQTTHYFISQTGLAVSLSCDTLKQNLSSLHFMISQLKKNWVGGGRLHLFFQKTTNG